MAMDEMNRGYLCMKQGDKPLSGDTSCIFRLLIGGATVSLGTGWQDNRGTTRCTAGTQQGAQRCRAATSESARR